jgi:hypothetical protein
MPTNTKPLVQVACICEKVLQEKDNVLSAIRIVDSFTVRELLPAGSAQFESAVDVTVLVALKSGDLVGDYEIRVQLRYPSGRTKDLPPFPMPFKGGHSGSTLTAQLRVEVKEYGLYYFDVIWQDEVLTSIPFLITTPYSANSRSVADASVTASWSLSLSISQV